MKKTEVNRKFRHQDFKHPFQCKEGYFESLQSNIFKKIHQLENPFVESLPFSSPENYFETLSENIFRKTSQQLSLSDTEIKLPVYSLASEEYFAMSSQLILDRTVRKRKNKLVFDGLSFRLSPQMIHVFTVFVFVLCLGSVLYFTQQLNERTNQVASLNQTEISEFLIENLDEIDLKEMNTNTMFENLDFINLDELSESEKEKLFLENIVTY
ncbi:MAG: hypothetical protein SNJ77_01430 [Cytophagales bacterium]